MPDANALNQIIACDSDFRIARDGTWHYQGSPIERQSMVRLFSTILTRDEAGEYWLKTPVEKCRIEVEDVPFLLVAFRVNDEGGQPLLCFKSNVNEWVGVDRAHPLEIHPDPKTGDAVPYIRVREGIYAKLARNVYYELMEYLLTHGQMQNGVRGVLSAGEFFALEGK